MTVCNQRSETAPIGGARCGKPATHTIRGVGFACDACAERVRASMRDPSSVICVLAGKPFAEEQIARVVRKVDAGVN